MLAPHATSGLILAPAIDPHPGINRTDVVPCRMMKIGTLAKKTGLTIRTLHYYEEIGLLAPSCRTASGHRLYGVEDVGRLQQIVSLRQLGFALADVRACLDQPDFSLQRTIELRLARLREEMALQERLHRHLEAVADHLRAGHDVSAEDLTQLIKVMTMIEPYYTPEQLEDLKERRAQVGEARIQEVQQLWEALFAAFDKARLGGVDPASLEVQALAQRAEALIGEMTGGDAGIRQSLNEAVKQDTEAMYEAWGITPELGAYYGDAMQALHAS